MKKLEGKKGLIIGIANESSIAWGCAQEFHKAGADLAVTYLNDKAYPFVQPLAERIEAPICLPLDVQNDEQMERLFAAIKQKWGKLDFLLHSIAYAPKEDLQGRVVDSSREGFLKAMDISCHSFIRFARLAEPLMNEGGSLLTISYLGGERYVPNYGIMGPIKSALNGIVRYLAAELGEKKIRVNALSPGPILTRAASGILRFDEIIKVAQEKSPEHEKISIQAVGEYARFLVSPEAHLITGNILYIDAGFNIVAP